METITSLIDYLYYFIISEETQKSFFLICLSSFIILFLLGISNKVVIFDNSQDLFWTVLIPLMPIILVLILDYLSGGDVDLTQYMFSSPNSIFWTTAVTIIIVYSIIRNFIVSVNANGLILGITVGIFKIVGATIVLILSFALFEKFFGKKNRGYGAYVITMLIFGIFLFFLKKLINGEKVRAERYLEENEY